MCIRDRTKSVDLKELAKRTEGYAGADLESLVREAAMLALRESMEAKEVTMKHFNEALQKVPPSVSKNENERYQKIEDNYLRQAKAAIAQQSVGKSYAG
jgi:SpoVK/Ycf46/Vps4 family AAA+-type ATPase